MSALHFIGKTDTKEEAFVLNELQEQALTSVQNAVRRETGQERLPEAPLESSWSCLSLTANL